MSEQDKSSGSSGYDIKANDISGQIAIGNNITQKQGVDPAAKDPTTQSNVSQSAHIAPNQLRKILIAHFNDGELRDVCFELGVEYESLPGEGKRDKARELVAECQRKNKLPALISICVRERPSAFQ